MIDWIYSLELIVCVAAGIFNLLLAAFNRKPSGLSISVVAVSLAALLLQLVVTVAVLISGQTAVDSIGEFFGYLLVALLLPLGAAAWALVERTRQSTAILGLAPLVVAVMIYRMMSIWTGQ